MSAVLMCGRLAALSKPDGGVRGIATGTTLRRLVGRTLAKQFAKAFEAECCPLQYALSTRAGTDCVQVEGGEQGDPLMPLLFSIGIQGALEEVSTQLLAGEQMCAFLDDVYVVCQPGRVHFMYNTVRPRTHSDLIPWAQKIEFESCK